MPEQDQSSRNQQVITEFRANGGKVGGYFADISLLLLTTTGARSSQSHTTPLSYLADGGRYVVFAAVGGAPGDQPQITTGTITSRYGTAAAVGKHRGRRRKTVTEVPRAQGRTALPWTVRPEKQWAMLRHHAGAGGLACRTASRVADAASDFCSSAGSARTAASRPGCFGAHAREVNMSSAG